MKPLPGRLIQSFACCSPIHSISLAIGRRHALAASISRSLTARDGQPELVAWSRRPPPGETRNRRPLCDYTRYRLSLVTKKTQ